jgi:diguanylate cyclase (GGDEF)-like protein
MQYFLQNAIPFFLIIITLGVVSIFSFAPFSPLFYSLSISILLLALFSFLAIRNRLKGRYGVKPAVDTVKETASVDALDKSQKREFNEVTISTEEQNLPKLTFSGIHNHQVIQSVLTEIHSEHNSCKLRSLIIKNAVFLCGAHGGILSIFDSQGSDHSYFYSPLSLDLPSNCQSIVNSVSISKIAVITGFSDIRSRQSFYILATPLLIDNLSMGVIILVNKTTQFCETDLVNLNLFASQAALAIHNARLYEKAILQAQTDSLTGLYNHRHFFELAKREISRAQRYKHSLTVAMVDIDHFKYINDTFGHPAGDQVLIAIANVCRKLFRNIDIVGRYGGEEFSILLPETPIETATEVAERFRYTIEKTAISYHRRHISVTVSLGLAALRNDCTSLNRLIERADTALYHAKAQGRNRVTLWKASMCYVGAMKYPRTFLCF